MHVNPTMLNARETRMPDSGILQLLQNYPSKEQHLTNREDPPWYDKQQKKKKKIIASRTTSFS